MANFLSTILELPSDEKKRLFAGLARHMLEHNHGRLAVRDAAGEMLVYSVPTNARANAEKLLRETEPAALAELHRLAKESRDDDMTEGEVIRVVKSTDTGSSRRS